LRALPSAATAYGADEKCRRHRTGLLCLPAAACGQGNFHALRICRAGGRTIMDWPAFELSVRLGLFTVLLLVPIALLTARWLAVSEFPGKSLLEATLASPLVLPPTVVGYYLLV